MVWISVLDLVVGANRHSVESEVPSRFPQYDFAQAILTKACEVIAEVERMSMLMWLMTPILRNSRNRIACCNRLVTSSTAVS